ncbi:Na+/H+ antiporter NhaA [Kocuria rhizophila]|nr:Na+/H+ antiporter NhaA [Kocuria rhizophila]
MMVAPPADRHGRRSRAPWSEAYFGSRDAEVGPGEVAGPQQTAGHWASDGLLATSSSSPVWSSRPSSWDGELHNLRKAYPAAVAAVGGVAVPALIFLGINLASGGDPRPCTAGPSPRPRTSPSRSRCSRSWDRPCRWPCARSC